MTVTTKMDNTGRLMLLPSGRNTMREPDFLLKGKGACRSDDCTVDPDAFTEDNLRSYGKTQRESAKSVCRSCPFSHECLEWGIESFQTGIWGGTWLTIGQPDPRR